MSSLPFLFFCWSGAEGPCHRFLSESKGCGGDKAGAVICGLRGGELSCRCGTGESRIREMGGCGGCL